MIKLFAMDMDGTVLNSESKINDNTIDAIRKLNKAGVKTVLCSGRVATSIEYGNKVIGLDNPVIGNNGAIIKLNRDEIFFEHPLGEEHLKELIEFAEENNCVYHFYDEDTYYSNRLSPNSIKHLTIDNETGLNIQCNLNISDDPYSKLKLKGTNAYKVLVGNLTNHPYGEEKVVSMFKERFGEYLYITTSGPGSIEIMEMDVSKWNAVSRLAEFLGIKEDEIAAIGDSFNDLPMIENAKLSFAMGNGADKLKEIAKYTVSDNNTRGIADACEIILDYNKENASV